MRKWTKGAANESEIYGRLTQRSSFTQRRRYVTDGAMVTEWAVISKQRFCNALVVEHKYNTSFPINEAHNYKREDNKS